MSGPLHLVPEVYEGHRLTFIDLDGKPHVLAREVGRILGYAEEGRAFVSLLREWSDDLRPGEHVVKVEGDQLAWLKERLSSESMLSHTRAVLLLTDRGLLRALMLAGGPVAVRFRDWAEEVLLRVATTGAYAPPTADPAPPVDELVEAEPPRRYQDDPTARRAECLISLATAVRRTGGSRALAEEALVEAGKLFGLKAAFTPPVVRTDDIAANALRDVYRWALEHQDGFRGRGPQPQNGKEWYGIWEGHDQWSELVIVRDYVRIELEARGYPAGTIREWAARGWLRTGPTRIGICFRSGPRLAEALAIQRSALVAVGAVDGG